MNLFYIIFGHNIHNHQQALFSIYTFLLQRKYIKTISVITDQPTMYTRLADEIEVISITPQELLAWQGEHQFFWRIKIKAIEMMCAMYPGEPVMYLDTDTLLFNDIASLTNTLQNNAAAMHLDEGDLSKAKSKTERKMWRQVGNKPWGNVSIDAKHHMWNAGVVALPNTKNGQEVQTALQICDAMCAAGVTRRLIEQYALSVSLQHYYLLQPAAGYIAHYWSNKGGWNQYISNFFITAFCQDLSHAAIMSRLEQADFKNIPLQVKVKNTKMRVQRLIEKVWPDKNLEYLVQSKHLD